MYTSRTNIVIISRIRVICSICVGIRIFLVFLRSLVRRISFQVLGTVTDISVGFISIYTVLNSHFLFSACSSLWKFYKPSLTQTSIDSVYTVCLMYPAETSYCQRKKVCLTARTQSRAQRGAVLMVIVRKQLVWRLVKVLLRGLLKVASSLFLSCSPWRSSNAIPSVVKRHSSWRNSFNTVTWIAANVIKYPYTTERSEPSLVTSKTTRHGLRTERKKQDKCGKKKK
jgi:hypothetical protein